MLRPQGLRAVFGRHRRIKMSISISDICLFGSFFFHIFAQLLHTVSNETCMHAMQHTHEEYNHAATHTAPHCTTLQHAAPHTATHYNTLQHTAAMLPFKHMSMLCSVSLKISNVFRFNIECGFHLCAFTFNEQWHHTHTFATPLQHFCKS